MICWKQNSALCVELTHFGAEIHTENIILVTAFTGYCLVPPWSCLLFMEWRWYRDTWFWWGLSGCNYFVFPRSLSAFRSGLHLNWFEWQAQSSGTSQSLKNNHWRGVGLDRIRPERHVLTHDKEFLIRCLHPAVAMAANLRRLLGNWGQRCSVMYFTLSGH